MVMILKVLDYQKIALFGFFRITARK